MTTLPNQSSMPPDSVPTKEEIASAEQNLTSLQNDYYNQVLVLQVLVESISNKTDDLNQVKEDLTTQNIQTPDQEDKITDMRNEIVGVSLFPPD